MNLNMRQDGALQHSPWVPKTGMPQKFFELKIKDGGKFEKIVTVTPAGRRRYMAVLLKWLTVFHKNCEHRGIPHEHRWWINTLDAEDIAWMKDKDRPSWVSHIDPIIPFNHNLSIYPFFKTSCEDRTIYIRLDDDVACAPPESLWNMVTARLRYPEPFLILGNTVNNALCSHLHQRLGITGRPPNGYGQYFCTDKNGWGDGVNAEFYHRKFLEKGCDAYRMEGMWQLGYYERYSINTICWTGEDMAETWKDGFDPDEEHFLTVDRPMAIKRPNAIALNAVFSHFAFGIQREHMDRTDVLEKYDEWADSALNQT